MANKALEFAVFNRHMQDMHMETFVRISRLIDPARSLTRSWQS